MKKYIVNLFIALSFQAVYCEEPVIPATNGQVRAFRSAFAAEITAQSCQFEAIGIFVFINKLVSGQMTPQQENTFENLGVNPIQIAEAVRLGYGFDRGVCSDLVVSPTEMASYKTALTGIGKHVSNKSKKAEEKHVFTTNASQATITAHLNLSNSLMYKAEKSAAKTPYHVKFMYAHAKIAGDENLEISIDSTPTEIEALREKAVKFLAPLFSTNAGDLRKLDTLMLQRIGEFSEYEERGFRWIFLNAGKDVHHEEEAERKSSDENQKPDFQSMFLIADPDVRAEMEKAERENKIGRALGILYGLPEKKDERTPETLEKFLRKLSRKGQKNCFDALVSKELVGSLLEEYEKQNPLNFTSLLTLCAHKDIPDLTLPTKKNIPEHERKAGAGAGTDSSHLTFVSQSIAATQQDEDVVSSSTGAKSHHHHAKKPLALTAYQEKVISEVAQNFDIPLEIIMKKFSIEQLTLPIVKLRAEVVEFISACEAFYEIDEKLVSAGITHPRMRDCFERQTAKQTINFVNMIKLVPSHNEIELIEKLSAAVLIRPEILDNITLKNKVIDWLYGAEIDAEDSLFAAECGFLPNKESFKEESEHSWGDIAQQEDLQRKELRLERQQNYIDVNSDIINMSLDLTEDEFRHCYFHSFEERKDGSFEDIELNTDLLKELIQKALSSKIR